MPAMKKVPSSDCSRIAQAFNKLSKQIGKPVDFELPDWFDNGKTMPYTYIKHNIYLTKKIKKRIKGDGIFCSAAVCGSRDCHCDCSSGSECGSSCLDKPFHNGTVKTMNLLRNSDCSRIARAFNKLSKQIGNPVDFELPYWLDKWKTTSYIYIKRNIYITKKLKKRVKDDGIFCSCKPLPGSAAICGSRDCHCGMLRSTCSSGCKCGSSCLNKPFQNRPVKKMKLVQTEKCGAGIVAAESVKRGEFVIEYVGEVIDDKTCEERLWNMKDRGETNFYLCEINRNMVIDASYKGNKSRYINHGCCPNTEMQKWIIDGETRVGIFATRDIKKGEHLTYDYRFVQFGADQDCHCGALGCRGKLGVKPMRSSNHFRIDALTLKCLNLGFTVSRPRSKRTKRRIGIQLPFENSTQCLELDEASSTQTTGTPPRSPSLPVTTETFPGPSLPSYSSSVLPTST